MFSTILGFVMMTIKVAPETPIAHWLHRYFVELPIQCFEGLGRRQVIFLIIGLIVIQGYALIGTVDLGVVAAWDLSLYLDIAGAVWMLSAVSTARQVVARIVLPFRRRSLAAAAITTERASKRRRHVRRNRRPANDDFEAPVLVMTA